MKETGGRAALIDDTRQHMRRMALAGFKILRRQPKEIDRHQDNYNWYHSYSRVIARVKLDGLSLCPEGYEDLKVKTLGARAGRRGFGRMALYVPMGVRDVVLETPGAPGVTLPFIVSSRGAAGGNGNDLYWPPGETEQAPPSPQEPNFPYQLAVAGFVATVVEQGFGQDMGSARAGELFEQWGVYRDLEALRAGNDGPYWTVAL